MKLISKKDNIIYLTFPTTKELVLTMCRPQEYYESPNVNIRNKVFSYEKFIEQAMTDQGAIGYFESWSGFNVPSNSLEKFFQKFDLTTREKQLYKLVKKATSSNNYYLIATETNDIQTMKHEFVHAYFYLNKSYRKLALELVDSLPEKTYNKLCASLLDIGYHKSVLKDEINAYLSTSSIGYLKDRFNMTFKSKDLKQFRDLARTVLK